jgi:hypothetical protein
VISGFSVFMKTWTDGLLLCRLAFMALSISNTVPLS